MPAPFKFVRPFKLVTDSVVGTGVLDGPFVRHFKFVADCGWSPRRSRARQVCLWQTLRTAEDVGPYGVAVIL